MMTAPTSPPASPKDIAVNVGLPTVLLGIPNSPSCLSLFRHEDRAMRVVDDAARNTAEQEPLEATKSSRPNDDQVDPILVGVLRDALAGSVQILSNRRFAFLDSV